MVVVLFTSRVVLQTLGVTDYGINNVVGGVVMMFGFVSGTLMSITQRFISVELGKSADIAVLGKIYSTSMILHIAAAVVVVILAETVGVWFLNNKLIIPIERMEAANCVYQFAVFGFVLSLLNAPLMALVISHEDMHIYGYMGIFDVIAKLLTVYLLVIINADKLIFMAFFGFVVTCVVWFFYFFYCRWKYKYARFKLIYEKALIKELSEFGGYMFGSNVFAILLTQGINIMLNIFFGPAINAAKGLASSVNIALQSFGNNFRQAIVPQITMSYAANETATMWNLVERGTRMSYFLFSVFSVPVLLKTEFVLKLWLGNVPEYTAIFVRLMILDALLSGTTFALSNVAIASGKLKIWVYMGYVFSVIILLLSYLSGRMGYSPQYILAISPFSKILFLPIYIVCAKKLFKLSISFFTQKALIPIFFVSVVSFLPFYFANKLLYESFLNSLIIITTSMLWTSIVIMHIGLRKNERAKVFVFVKRKFCINKS